MKSEANELSQSLLLLEITIFCYYSSRVGTKRGRNKTEGVVENKPIWSEEDSNGMKYLMG